MKYVKYGNFLKIQTQLLSNIINCIPVHQLNQGGRRSQQKIIGNSDKSSTVHQNILSPLVRKGADLEVIEDKAEQLLDRTRLNKYQNNKTRPNEFTKLILQQKYEKIKKKD